MKVLFIKDVPRQGQMGQVKEVADGFAKFLLNNKSVIVATPVVIEQNKKKIEEALARAKGEESFLLEISKKIDGMKIQLKGESNPKGNLYKSIHGPEVAEELSRVLGTKINPHNVEEVTLKKKGEHEIKFLNKGKNLAKFILEII